MEPRASSPYRAGRRRRRPASRPSSPASPSPSTAPFGPEDFPGCESFPLPAAALERYEGRLEFWDGYTETAWRVCEPTTIQHEIPTHRLPWLARALTSFRGPGIACLGSADLVCRDASGGRCWLMQADGVLYLHPSRSRPRGQDIDVERDPLPDVVLEVDYTTDVRSRKLGIYMEAGFPEVWVLVPPGSRRAGYPRVTIHVREGEGYRTAEGSGAIPGFTKDEIFRALTECPWSGPTWRAVERVGRSMGAREGTGPEDDPLSRSLLREGEAKGRKKGRAEGRAEGRREGRAEGRAEGPARGACGDGARGARLPGHRGEPGARRGAGARRRPPGRGADVGGPRVHERGGPPAPRPRGGPLAIAEPLARISHHRAGGVGFWPPGA